MKKIKNNKYLEWVRQQHCYLCDPNYSPRGPSEPHHMGNLIGTRRGHDDLVIPLCRYHHRMIHDNPYVEERLELRRITRWYYDEYTRRDES